MEETPPTQTNFVRLVPGTEIDNRYVVTGEPLGSGGMGTVFPALQKNIQRKVAIKVLRKNVADELDAVKRFMREARAASFLNHPNIVTVHDFGQMQAGPLYLVMEHVEGRSLRDILLADKRLSPDRTMHLTIQLLNALEDAHAHGVIHRDLKPANILVTPHAGNPDFVKVLDFGLAKVPGDGVEVTRTGQVFGTPAYLSPEQARGDKCDARADLYAMGILLFEMLTGRRPFVGESSMAVLLGHMRDAPPSISALTPTHVPDLLQRVVYRALEKSPDARFQTAAEMRDALLVAQAAPREPGDTVADGTRPVTGVVGSVDRRPSASSGPDTEPDASSGLASASLSQLPDDPPSAVVRAFHDTLRGRRRAIVAAVAGVACVAAVAVLFVTRARRDEPPVAPVVASVGGVAEPRVASTAPAPAAVASVVVELTSVPPGASVEVRGTGVDVWRFPRTPASLAIASGTPLVAVFRLDGHEPFSETLAPASSMQVQARLVPLPMPPSVAETAPQSPASDVGRPVFRPRATPASSAAGPRRPPSAPAPSSAAPAAPATRADGWDDLK